MLKANEEFTRFSERSKKELSSVEKHFLESIEDTAKQLKGKSLTTGEIIKPD